MKNLALIVVAILATILVASCEKSNDELPQLRSQKETVGKGIPGKYSPTSLPLTTWSFKNIDHKRFYGINGDDFYVISASHNSSEEFEIIVTERDASGNTIVEHPLHVQARQMLTQAFWTNNDVYSVDITTRGSGRGRLTIMSGNRR